MNKIEFIDKLFNSKVLFLAPMAGYTDIGFRHLCKSFGADVVVTEMISAKALCHKSKNTFKMLAGEPEDRPIALQLFGNSAVDFAFALDEIDTTKFDIIDINMGCPAPKIVKNKEGSYLMENIEEAEKIIRTVVSKTDLPVSVKFRSGVDENNITAVSFAKMCENAGASFITLHPRTRSQGYSGKANYSLIKEVVNNVSIPVVASGDCLTIFDYNYLCEECGCRGVMIGRGALGNPEIFAEIKNNKKYALTLEDKIKQIKEHILLLQKVYADIYICSYMKKHVIHYIKRFNINSNFKLELLRKQTLNELIAYLDLIKAKNVC